MKTILNFIVIILISFLISVLVYLSLMDGKRKPTTYKEFTLEHFLK